MKADKGDDLSLTLPLVFDEKQQEAGYKLQDIELNHHDNSLNSASFLNTCFNGVNALSGYNFAYLSHLHFT